MNRFTRFAVTTTDSGVLGTVEDCPKPRQQVEPQNSTSLIIMKLKINTWLQQSCPITLKFCHEMPVHAIFPLKKNDGIRHCSCAGWWTNSTLFGHENVFFFAKKLRKNVQSTIMQYLFCLNRAMETVVCLRLKILYQTQTVRLLIPVSLCFHLFENFGPNSLQKPLEKLKIFNQML